MHACVGGTSVSEDIKILKRGGIHMIVGTPGRVEHMMKKQVLKTEYLRIFVMDEADDMLELGFRK